MAFQGRENNTPSPSGADSEELASINFSENLLNREKTSGGLEHIVRGFFYGHECKVVFFLASPRVKPT
jgi:hypothetical protein